MESNFDNENIFREAQAWFAKSDDLNSEPSASVGASAESAILPTLGNLSLGVTLGVHHESDSEVFQFNEDRFRHCLILGRTGAGKSNHIAQMQREDIRSGAGVFILAAHEDDALYPLSCVPEERLGDVVFFDASNPEYLPRMNPLDVPDSQEAASKAINDVLELIAGDLRHEWFGARGEDMLRNALGLMLMKPVAGAHSIIEVNQMYTDAEHVKDLLKYCTDKNIYDYWTKVYPGEMKSRDGGEVIHWFLSKFSRITDDHVLRHVFGEGKSTIDIKSIVDESKIFIAYIPETRIGMAAADILSRYLILQLRNAVMNRRSEQAGWQGLSYGLYEDGSDSGDITGPDPFFVYVDEFAKYANFAGSEFESLLAESRKMNCGLILSTQTLSQTRTYEKKTGQVGKLEESILGNVGSIICYPIGVRDAELLSEQFDVDIEKLKRIERYRPLARLCIDNHVARPGTLEVGRRPAVDNPSAARRVAKQMVESGMWVEVEGARSKGSFFKAVEAPEDRASSSNRSTVAIEKPDPGSLARAVESCTAKSGRKYNPCRMTERRVEGHPSPEDRDGTLPHHALMRKLLELLMSEYSPCLPSDWSLSLEDAMKRGFEDARESYVPFLGVEMESFAKQYMRAHAALTVADFVDMSLPEHPSGEDFCFCVRAAARNGIEYAEKHHEWSSFHRTLGTLPAGVIEAWSWVNDPDALRAQEEMAIQYAGGSCSVLFDDG